MANKKWQQRWSFDFTDDAALDAEIAEAEARAIALADAGPCAEAVWYNSERQLIEIQLKNGAIFSFPPHLAQGLTNAAPHELENGCLGADGLSVHWDSLDADFSVLGLIQGIFGTKTWMAELGRRGGQRSSVAKQQAARANGKKGGRPKKTKPRQPHPDE
ncbi:DUF2442 domain-containing protein [Spirulina major CS-329]|jgi:hypothetical protein|uniref:DUF2442 domain-containing protein n=1 Tax=Spirulina TaxID=1154 RepID=UPI00232C69F8|nr:MULTISPECIES: DUF2442 domain-containing protein [Spirulina]MDB9495356.1 DUF2442 domain-containing protein [Spirulina subsalsa CS-330]MDB9504995.1 DUF2442 domain-containing protein [Spirulina major CS-329]